MSNMRYEVLPYLFSLGFIMLGALWLATLLAATLDLVFENLDIGFLFFGVLYFLGLTAPNYLLRWVATSASVYSDFGGIEPVGRLVVCNRLFWLFLAAAVVLVGFWWRRLPGFPRRVALVRNAARGLVPLGALAAMALATWLYTSEPYLFPADSVFQRDLPRSAQAWLTAVTCDVRLRPRAKTLAADVCYEFGKEPAQTRIELVTNKGLRIDSLKVNGTDAAWHYLPRTDRIQLDLPAGPSARVELRYHGRIRYPVPGGFPGYISTRSIYLLENSHWLFEPRTEARGPIGVSGAVTAPAHLTVVTPGKLESITREGESLTWRFKAVCPELALGLFAAEYEQETLAVGSTTVEFYFSPRHADYIRAAGVTDHIRDILAFCGTFTGTGPWENMPLKIVETSVYKPGGHASLNVVTMAEYLLNRIKAPDPSTMPRFILRDLKILAHELAHQWWGGGVAIAESGAWSSEGLAEYMAYKYLAAQYPAAITDSIARGWRGSAAQGKHAYWRKDPRALERMRPALREKLLTGQARGRAYSVLPLRLLAAEERLGAGPLQARLAEVFRRHRGTTLPWESFVAILGPGTIDLCEEQP